MSDFYDEVDEALADIETKATSPRPYTHGSISVVDGYGNKGEQPPSFNYSKSLGKFQGWIYACADKNAKAAASIPLRLYVKRRSGRRCLWNTKSVSPAKKKYLSGDLGYRPSMSVLKSSNQFGNDFEEIIDDHPVLTLLSQVNPWQNQFDLAYLRFLYLELTGNAYLHHVDGNLGVPEQLYVLPSQWVTVIPSERGSETLIDGYYYGRDKQDQVGFDPSEVIHFRYPNPSNIYYGLGKVEAGWLVVNVDYENWSMRFNMLKNSMRPDYAVIMKSLEGNNAGMQRYGKMLEGMLRGSRNQGRMITLPGDISLQPLQWSPRDMGKDDKTILEQICAVFGVPISEIQNNDANYSNGQQGSTSWWRNTILSMLRMDEQKLNEQLLPLFNIDGDAFLAYDNPVPEDQAIATQRTTMYLEKGVITPNEVRASEGLLPLEDGDIPLPALQYELMGRYQLGTTGIGGPARGGTPEGGDSSPREEDSEGEKSYRGKQVIVNNYITLHKSEEGVEVQAKGGEVESQEESPSSISTSEPEITKLGAFMAKYVDDIEAKNSEDNYVTQVERIFGDYFSRQKQLVIDYVKAGQKNLKDDLTDMIEGFNDSIVDELQVPLQKIWQIGALDALKDIGLSSDVFDVYNPEVSTIIRDKNIKLAGQVSQTTIEGIRASLLEGMEAGESIQQLTKRIQEASEFSSVRSEMIARTESAVAFEESGLEAWKASGQVERVKWLLAPNPCPSCQAIASQINSVPLGQPFISKGSTFNGVTYDYRDIKSAPAHPRCRCSTQAQLKE